MERRLSQLFGTAPALSSTGEDEMSDAKLDAMDEVLQIVHDAGFKEFHLHQVKELQEAFSLFDLDGGGDIDATELGTVMRSLGANPSDDEIQKMIEAVDADGSGSIEFPEFCLLMARKTLISDCEEELMEAFRVFEQAEAPGFISTADLRYVLAALAENLTDADLDEIVSLADSNGDGLVSFERFATLMQLHKRRGIKAQVPDGEGDAHASGESGTS